MGYDQVKATLQCERSSTKARRDANAVRIAIREIWPQGPLSETLKSIRQRYREQPFGIREVQVMDNATIIGISMTILSIIAFIVYRKGWIK